MTKSIAVLIFLSLIGLNFYIYWNTEKKMEAYAISPPFRMEDFTKSHRKNKFSKIKNLTDQNKNTFWIKEQNSFRPDYDLELELALTHVYSQSKFKKKDFHFITFHSCLSKDTSLRSPKQLQVDLFLREAINIDKELRLPNDSKVVSFPVDFKNADFVKIDISNLFTLLDSNRYPENIYIVTLFLKDNSKHEVKANTCLAEIEIE